MKKYSIIIYITFIVSICEAQIEIPTEERKLRMEQTRMAGVAMLSTAWNIPFISQSQIWEESLFQSQSEFHADGFHIIEDNPLTYSIPFLVYTNDQIVAYGNLFEHSTYNDARTALLFELMNNNMMLNAISDRHRSYPKGVGDFCIIRKKREDTTDEIVDDYSIIYFVRGAKAISLRGADGADVRPIAKALDEVLITGGKKNDETSHKESQSYVEDKSQQINSPNTIIEKQTPFIEDAASFTISTEVEDEIDSPKSSNRIWFYIGVGVFLLYAIVYFLRKKPNQKKTS